MNSDSTFSGDVASTPPSANKPHTMIVIDDHPLFRKGVADLISMDDNLALIGDASSGQEGLKLAAEKNPDLVLLDLHMKGMDGLETLKAMKELDINSRIIILTVSDAEEDVVAALRLGADGYLLKDMEPEDTLELLHTAAKGRLVISDKLTELIARALRGEPQPKGPGEAGLTDREQQILKLIAEGLSNKLIARKLDISEGTVKVHVKHLLKKLNLRSRVEAAVWVVNRRKGL